MINEQKIIQGIIAGDETILKNFYKRNYPAIRAYVLQNAGTSQDIEDVFQDAMVIVYQKLRSGTLILQASVHTYFYGVCKNLWRTRLRLHDKEVLVASLWDNFNPGEVPVIQAITEQTVQEQLYRKYFCMLPRSAREIWYLYIEGKSAREIAAIMGYSEGYVRKKKFLAKKKVLQMISNDPMYKEVAVR